MEKEKYDFKLPLQVAKNKYLMEAENHLCVVTINDKREIVRAVIFKGHGEGVIIVDYDDKGHKRYRAQR